MSIETETWEVERKSASAFSIETSLGDIEASGEYAEDLLDRVAVLPEALAALKDAAQYDHDGLCWGMAPCSVGKHDERCLRNRNILRRAGVLE